MTEDQARERVIRSMCPDRVCRTCGEPSRRMFETNPEYVAAGYKWGGLDGGKNLKGTGHPEHMPRSTVPAGFTDCGHDNWRPGVWLDPFNPEAT